MIRLRDFAHCFGVRGSSCFLEPLHGSLITGCDVRAVTKGDCELLEVGDGVAHQPEEAFRWYTKAAEAGHSDAMWFLALILHAGGNQPPDFETAARYLLDAAKAGHDKATAELRDGLRKFHRQMRVAVQEHLTELGLYSGAIDGSLGPGSQRAIEAYLSQS